MADTKKYEIVPKERPVKKNAMFANRENALAWYDFLYNKYIRELLKYNKDKAEAYKDVLLDIKGLADSLGLDYPLE